MPARRLFFPLLGLGVLLVVGCKEPPPPPVAYEPNYLFAHRMGVSEEISTDQYLADTQNLLEDWFGTPDQPKLPPLLQEDEYSELVSLKTMEPAVGPGIFGKEPGERGLYRQFCVSCHGETGQGRGGVAASQNPYPRDFRRGMFKYKVTARNSKPLKSDIAKTLKDGLNGTQMPAFTQLSDAQINALVEYVVYLSIRGEFERRLVTTGVMDLDPDKAMHPDPSERERLYDVSYRDATEEAAKKAFADQLDVATEVLTGVADLWLDAEMTAKLVSPPSEIPVPGLTDEGAIDRTALEASIAKGKKLFVDEVASCAKCHGPTGKGDGQPTPDFDDWTKEWTAQINIKPDDLERLYPFMALGGLKPQPLMPRNLIEGKFRGGRDPRAVYHRIFHGVTGTPMPAAAMATSPEEKGLQPDDVWHLVNYVLSIKVDEPAKAIP